AYPVGGTGSLSASRECRFARRGVVHPVFDTRRNWRNAAPGGNDWSDRNCRPSTGGDQVNALPGIYNYLTVGAILFGLGIIGFLARRNLIIMFLSAEMMLQGVAINLVAFARYRGNLEGQVFTLFIITVAACEAAIALALILMLYRSRRS